MRILFFGLIVTLLGFSTANAFEMNDLLSAYVDNDELGQLLATNPEQFTSTLVESPLLSHVETRGYFYNAETVLDTLSPYLESQFDTIIIANTATTGSSADMIPFQHARILVKNSSELSFFKRDTNGKITGIIEENITTLEGLPQNVPISSGVAGNGGIRTFSGIFRVNVSRSKSHLKTSPGAGMSYAVYVDASYGKRASGVAIHGTPKKNHKKLGNVRASHGCLRTFPEYATIIYNHIIKNEAMKSQDAPKFKNLDNLPDGSVQSGGNGTEAGVKALFIIFDGYENQTQDI